MNDRKRKASLKPTYVQVTKKHKDTVRKANYRASSRRASSSRTTSRRANTNSRDSSGNIKKKKKSMGKKVIWYLLLLLGAFCIISYYYSNYTDEAKVIKEYFNLLKSKKYGEMYKIVECELSEEEFVNRIKNIYEGIEADNISVGILSNMILKNIKNKNAEVGDVNISYRFSMDTIAGNVNYISSAPVIKKEKGYKIKWDSSMILPNLKNNEKVRVRSINYVRGSLLDRNGKALAKDSTIYEIGIVPSKFEIQDVNKVADLLNINAKELINELNSNSVIERDYYYIKKLPKEEQELKNSLLKIKGIIIGDADARVYPYKEATSIMTGYVKDGEGKAGLEESFNDELKGIKGAEIYIEDDGQIKEVVAKKDEINGIDIKTTIDVNIQTKIYEELAEDTGLAVALNYNTGEVLALVSTPSYDANKFTIGLTNEEWEEIQNDSNNPMFNRYLASFTPGSTIKPIIGAIGMEKGILDNIEEPSRKIKKWQKDSSWRDFYITTLELYDEPANMENALVYSDNIYFAKLALELGRTNIENGLDDLGFNSDLDFEQEVAKSTYGELDNEKTIATTGFGQAKVMVNPILMASIYSAFANGGNMVKPYLRFEDSEENRIKNYKENIISDEVANEIRDYLIEVVKRGTGEKCFIENRVIAGKTGTAEIKKDQNDINGTENGWFNSFDDNGNLYICMIEDVKNKGGSAYVVEKMKNIYEKK